MTANLDTRELGFTDAGRSVAWYVDEQVQTGVWREEVVPSSVSGLSRPITVFRAPRRTNLITYDWHGDASTFCPPMWWDLAIGSGACGLGCRACFLMLTHRIRRDPMRHLLYDNVEDFSAAAERWLRAPARRWQHTLGVGIDRSDSLLYEGLTGHVRRLAPIFASETTNPQRCKLILLTKTANTRYLEEIAEADRKRVVVSFSLNPQAIADCWEGVWEDGSPIPPSIQQRLEAARHAQDLGYEVRVRVDPILTPAGWEEAYADFMQQVQQAGVHFTYWTLGTYREKNTQLLAWAQRWGVPAMEWQPDEADMVQDGTHRHLSEQRRIEIYTTVSRHIQAVFPSARVNLCKETHTVRKAMPYACKADCNCLV